MKLYSYYRSSAAYRVRIALNLKGIKHSLVPVNLLEKQHQSPEYKDKQPQGLVPCLETQDGQFLSQSGAIIQYLEVLQPLPSLLPVDPLDRATVQGFVDIIACDIHPICNLRVINYVTNTLQQPQAKLQWLDHWMGLGFNALEKMLIQHHDVFNDALSLADIYLIPQIYNALRFELDISLYPKIYARYQRCNQLDAFIAAKPENQPDAL
jgi:maleylpyruvate isomerase